MYIYLDEAGDLGFSERSSRHFIIALLIPKNRKTVKNCIKRTRQRRLKKKYREIKELKFHDSSHAIRNGILECLSRQDIEINYIFFEKGDSDQTDRKTLVYNMLSGYIISKVARVPATRKITLIVDKSLPKKHQQEFNECIKERIQSTIKEYINVEIKHVNSEEDNCLQATDFVAGAIFKKHEHGIVSYFQIIESKIKETVQYRP